MKICTIIVSYNFEKWIHTCLSSVKNSSVESAVLVIDNASSDHTCKIIARDYPDVILWQNHENLGFGKANNLGMRYAIEQNFDYVFLLNQDAWIEPDALEKMILASEKHPDFGIISPIHLNGLGDKPDFGFSAYTGLKTRRDIRLLPEGLVSYNFINAAMWLIPIAALKNIGGFAPIFPHYGEDVNFSQRARKSGYKTGVLKSAIGYHDREAREKSDEKFYYSEFIYFLTEAVNPTYSPFQSFASSVLAAKKKALIALFSGKWNAFSKYLRIVCRLLSKRNAIQNTRKKTMRTKMPYL